MADDLDLPLHCALGSARGNDSMQYAFGESQFTFTRAVCWKNERKMSLHSGEAPSIGAEMAIRRDGPTAYTWIRLNSEGKGCGLPSYSRERGMRALYESDYNS